MRVTFHLFGLDLIDFSIETGGGDDVAQDSGYTTSYPVGFSPHPAEEWGGE